VPKRILIVDDNDVVRKIVRGILEEEDGWEVCGEAANGREAIEKARQLTPDVIVLDLAMPVMDGLQAARELTQILPAVPLLMFTNFESTCLKQEALSAGISALVSKSESIGGRCFGALPKRTSNISPPLVCLQNMKLCSNCGLRCPSEPQYSSQI